MEAHSKMDEQQRKQLAYILATWKSIGEGIESKPLVTLTEHVEALLRQNDAGAERLKKSMEREAALKADNERLAKENKQLAETIARYDAHPEVRAAKLAAIVEQQKQLAAQAESLKDPEPAKPE